MSSKESPKQPVEELALRIKPVRHAGRLNLSWIGARGAVAMVLGLVALSAGLLYLALHDAGSFTRRRIEFPALPQLNAAIAAAQERLRADPQDISSLVELGTLHFEKGKDSYPEAINELEEARELGALDPRIFYCLGIMYQEVGLYPFALEEYRRFLRHYPEDKEIRMLSAKLLYKQGRFSEAVSEYERLKFHFPNDSLVEENLGLSLWGAKTVERAVDSFKRLLALGGDHARRAHFYLGQIASDNGEWSKGLEHLEHCKTAPGDPGFGIPADKVLAAVAAARGNLGQLAEAREAWEQVLVLSPGDAKAKAAVRDLTRRLAAKRPTIQAKK